MLLAAFEAAAAYLPEPVMTPLIILPPAVPPGVLRKRRTKECVDVLDCNVRRDIGNDNWLIDKTTKKELGRVIVHTAVDNKRTKITSTHGQFVVDSNMRVLRGKVHKESIHGHVLATTAPAI